jgi:hypothetical protein
MSKNLWVGRDFFKFNFVFYILKFVSRVTSASTAKMAKWLALECELRTLVPHICHRLLNIYCDEAHSQPLP